MEFFSALIFFLVGIVVGVSAMLLRGRLTPNGNEVKQQLINLQQEQAHMQHEWDEQNIAYQKLAKNLSAISSQIEQQVEDAKNVLHKAPKPNTFPFFSNEATEFLKTTHREKREKVSTSNQPLDYSNAGSGVFKGISPQPTVEKSEA
jgi:uncharacterized membrane-anchored protein YhcB (DUF1043 family)